MGQSKAVGGKVPVPIFQLQSGVVSRTPGDRRPFTRDAIDQDRQFAGATIEANVEFIPLFGDAMARSTTRQFRPKEANGRSDLDVRYDAELFELWVSGIIVKRLDARALNQIRILPSFQELNWARRIAAIDNPDCPVARM
jgi:hypothetical protein